MVSADGASFTVASRVASAAAQPGYGGQQTAHGRRTVLCAESVLSQHPFLNPVTEILTGTYQVKSFLCSRAPTSCVRPASVIATCSRRAGYAGSPKDVDVSAYAASSKPSHESSTPSTW